MKQWTVRDVMTTDVATVREETTYRQIVDVLAERRISAVPVVDDLERVVGVVSEADLLHKVEFIGDDDVRHIFERPSRRSARTKAHGGVARNLMTAPAITVPPDASVVTAARLMEAERIKRLPVVDDLGRLMGIVSRSDLLRMHLRPDPAIREDVVEGVLRRSLWVDPLTVEVNVVNGLVSLRGKVDNRTTAFLAAQFTKAVPGVIEVVNELGWEFDDTELAASKYHRSHPFSTV